MMINQRNPLFFFHGSDKAIIKSLTVATCAVSAHHLHSFTVGMNCTGSERIKA